MSSRIRDDHDALVVAVQIIREQDDLLAAYRMATRPRERTLDALNRLKPRLQAYLKEATHD